MGVLRHFSRVLEIHFLFGVMLGEIQITRCRDLNENLILLAYKNTYSVDKVRLFNLLVEFLCTNGVIKIPEHHTCINSAEVSARDA